MIKAGNGPLGSSVIEVLNNLATGGRKRAIRVRQNFGKRVGTDETQSVGRRFACHKLERMVGGTSHGWIIVDETLILRKGLNGCSHCRVIVIVLKIGIRQTRDPKLCERGC